MAIYRLFILYDEQTRQGIACSSSRSRSHGQNRTGRVAGGNVKCGGSAPVGRGNRICRWGALATEPLAARSVRFDQAATGWGTDRRCLGRWFGIKPVRAAFVAKWRIPEDGGAAWCNGGAFGEVRTPGDWPQSRFRWLRTSDRHPKG